MKKKNGGALLWVLILSSVILIVGTAVFYLVFNSHKVDNSTEILSDLRIETATGLNIGAYYWIEEGHYKGLKVGEKQSLNNINLGGGFNPIDNIASDYIYYIDGVSVQSKDEINNYVEYSKYNLQIEIEKLSNTEYKIISTASFKGQTYSDSMIVNQSGSNFTIQVKNFIDSMGSLSILGKNTTMNDLKIKTNSYNDSLLIQGATFNINGNLNEIQQNIINNNADTGLTPNLGNNSMVTNKSNGLNLALKQGGIQITDEEINNWQANMVPGEAILISNGNNNTQVELSNLDKGMLKNYTGIVMRPLNSGNLIIINNGDMFVAGVHKTTAYTIANTLIYSTGPINFTPDPNNINIIDYMNNHLWIKEWFGDFIWKIVEWILGDSSERGYNFNFVNTDIMSNKGIYFTNTGLNMQGAYNIQNKKMLESILQKIVE